MGDLAAEVRRALRDVPGFPTPGVLFRDITPVLADAPLFRRVIDWMATGSTPVDRLVAIESRGFVFGAALAVQTGAGLVLARKPGKLPRAVISVDYALEYGTATLQLHADAIRPGDRCLIVDDLLATGGTASAVVALVRQLGGEVTGALFLIELALLAGRQRLPGIPVTSLVQL